MTASEGPDAAPSSTAGFQRRRRPDASDYVAPRTPAEELLAAIFAELLEIDRVGMADNFLALGGDSLLATLLVVRIQDAFGIDLPPSAIFDAKDVAALCIAIQESNETTTVSAPPPGPQDRRGGQPISSEQGVLLFLHHMADDKSIYNIFRVFRVRTAIDVDALRKAFTALLGRHEILRTRLAFVDGQPAQQIDEPEPFALELIDLGALPAAQRDEAARGQAEAFVRRPFTLDADRLVRAALFRLSPDEHLLAISMHHLVSDASSLNVMASDLGALYAAFSNGRASPLAPPRLHYADYALWQRVAYPLMEDGHVAYWKSVLDGIVPIRIGPADLDPAARNFDLGLLHFALPPALSGSVRDLSRREDTTAAMTLFSAFQVLLARQCRTGDIVGGMIFSRRTRPELQDVMGPMLIAHPVRTDIARQGDFRALLRHVKATVLDDYRHLEIDTITQIQRIMPQLWPLTAFNFVGGRAGPAKLLEARLRSLDPAASVDEVEFVDGKAGRAPADIAMEVYDYPDRLAGKITYSPDLFDDASIARFVDEFKAVLAEAAANPERPVSTIGLPS